MTLRFSINQAEAFRRGIDAPKSVVHLKVDPAKLSAADRDLIADHLDGIDVMQATGRLLPLSKQRIIAKDVTLESLLEAIRLNDSEIGEQ